MSKARRPAQNAVRLLSPVISLAALGLAGAVGGTELSEDWLKTQSALYQGPPVNALADLGPYTGEAAADRIVGESRRQAYLLNYRQLGVNYGDAVEYQLRREQVILCPQTAELLYSDFTPGTVRYEKGSRPVLEATVGRATEGCGSEKETVLALMRFCRDLRKTGDVPPWTETVFGGTEEEMIAKPEILCETLGRLMVALCEVAGIPGRVVMHVIGGHIGAEVLVDGNWAYIDPRCGMYFLKDDGSFASVLELMQNPDIIYAQTDDVKADVSDQWSWSFRAWKCANMYFSPREVNGFENYSLADAARYSYAQRTYAQADAAGLMDINADYVREAKVALGLEESGTNVNWATQRLRKIDIAYRHDGFSIFYKEPLMDRAELMERYITPFEGSNVGTLVWGLGPGSVFCYETRVGEIFGEGLNEEERALLREGDLWVHQNVMNLIEEGPGPLQMAVEGAHAIGRKILARLELNHEYGPASDDNWMWVAFVGSLNKSHPEYRIGKSVLLDFKHQEVRDFKLAILRESVEMGCDGVSLDFAVYPPFFEKPDHAIMTGFVRDVREMLDEVAQDQGRELELMARVPATDYMELGLDWKTWCREGLVNVIVPTHRRAPDYFDIRVEEFVAVGHETGTRVYPTIWQALGFVDTDQRPSDDGTGRRRYDKPKTQGMYVAQAMMMHRAGVDGIQLGFSEDQWRRAPWMNDLADPAKVLYADKHYMADPIAIRPGTFALRPEGDAYVGERRLTMRIGDDPRAAKRAGRELDATLVIYCRPLEDDETLSVYINGHGPVEIAGYNAEERARRGVETFDPRKDRHEAFLFERNWWKRGEHKLAVQAAWWQLQDNELELVYSSKRANVDPPLSITWIDLLLDYSD